MLNWPYIIQIARRHKRELILANVIATLAALASVPIPLLMPLLVDEVLLQQPGTLVGILNQIFPATWHGPVLYITAMLIVTISLRLISLLLGVLQSREFTLISKDITYRIRRRMLDHLENVSLAEYEAVGSGSVGSHLVTDVNAIDDFIGTTISRFVVAALTLIGVTGILLWINWKLALFILLVNPFVIYLTTRLGKRVKKLKARENSAVEIFQQALTETLDAIHQVRASNRDRYYMGKVRQQAETVKDHASNFAWRSDALNRFSFFIFLSGFEIFRAITMLMVLFSGLSIGQMMAVFGYLWFMMTPVQEVLGMQYGYFSANAALQRLNQLLKLDPEPDYPEIENPFKDKRTVSLNVQNVCFRYGDGPLVLDHVDLDIAAGEKIALVGASGGGKSTLVQVILGLYPAESGTVFFDGIPLTRIGLKTVRENVATVLQHPALFNDTVRMNLTLGREASEQQLWQALEIAQLEAVVADLPKGLDTVVGRQGVRLSGGQRQRLAVARMILSDPKLVILDEATSALDSVTENKLHLALNNFLKDRTTLIIAHRLSAVKQASRVYVFDGGRIIEQGHHNELIQQDGLYRKLYGSLQH